MNHTHKMFVYIENATMEEVHGDYGSITTLARLLLANDSVNAVRVAGFTHYEGDDTYEYEEDVPYVD